ncbi:MAG: hypothetical protein IIC24_11140, partial [Chloroflexi bacterium]|nr:hypothetical protein [Chloroflexota bacterium]
MADAQEILGDETIILSLQNGTENENRIRQHCSDTTILGGAICAYVEFSQPGEIIWSDDRGGLAASLY